MMWFNKSVVVINANNNMSVAIIYCSLYLGWVYSLS